MYENSRGGMLMQREVRCVSFENKGSVLQLKCVEVVMCGLLLHCLRTLIFFFFFLEAVTACTEE